MNQEILPNGKLEKLVQARITEEEHEELRKKAKSEGLSVAQAIRTIVNKYIAGEISLNQEDDRITLLEKKIQQLESQQKKFNEFISESLGELVA